MMHLIQPMGGGGVRFLGEGFESPKPLIMLRGKPFFYWAVQSVACFVKEFDLTFVVLADHVEKFAIDREIKKYYPESRIVVIPEVLNGAVLTCLEGVKVIDDGLPLLFNDCDHAFNCPQFYDFVNAGQRADGGLITFKSSDPAYSYVRYEGERAVGTVEKQVVSSDAICGAYYFKSRDIFEGYTARYLENCSYSEYFVSGVYNEMAKDGCEIKIFSLEENFSFGTPKEYKEAALCSRLEELYL